MSTPVKTRDPASRATAIAEARRIAEAAIAGLVPEATDAELLTIRKSFYDAIHAMARALPAMFV